MVTASRLGPYSSRPADARRVGAVLAGRRGLLGGAVGAALALGCLVAGPAAGQSAPQVLFQASYDRSGGPTDVYRAGFGTCDPTETYRLVVDNGVDGTRLVSSGSVLLNGVKVLDFKKGARQLVRSVSLRPTNALEVQLGGPRGGRVRVTVDGYPRCLQVRFIAPLADSTVSQPETLVAGEVDGQPPVGIRLWVSYPTPAGAVEVSVPVETGDRRFAAWVPLLPGTLGVTALAQDALGRSGEGTLAFSFVPAPGSGERPMRPDVEPTTGFAPLTVTFGCGVGPDALALELDVDGDGLADFDLADCAVPPYRVTHTYLTEGLYVATLTVRDGAGGSYVQQVPINVLPVPDLGRLWDGFRTALARADVEGALGFIAFEARERYRRALEDLRPDLATIAGGLGPLTPVTVQPRSATATTTRVLDGVTAVFVVSFVRDGDGVWRLASF